MFQFFKHRQKTAMRWFLFLIMGGIGFTMLVSMLPGSGGGASSVREDAVADVGGKEVTAAEVQRELQRDTRGQNIPAQIRALYMRSVLDKLMYERMVEIEAKRLGIRVTDEERAEEIKHILPGAFAGGSVASMESYAAAVEQQLQMSVTEFEGLVSQSLLESKVRRLVTDGLSVSPAEIAEEYKRKNEKVKLEYVVLKPAEMESQVPVTEADLASYFEHNKMKYQIPERRSLRYVLVDVLQLRQTVKPNDTELRAFYDQHVDRFKVQNRVHASHILFKTVGKTDAEVEEIRKKAADILAKVKKGGKFEELAKQNSDDTATKDKGGDLGWVLEGQTVPEFEKAAFGLAKGATSELVKTQFGFHIIHVTDRETAHIRSFDEVRPEIMPAVAAAKAELEVSAAGDKLAAAVRKSNRRPIDELGKEFGLPVGEVQAAAITEPLGALGSSAEVREFAFRAHPGDLSAPLHVDRGIAVVTVRDIQPARQATLADVHGKVDADYRASKAGELARQRAEELAQKVKTGEKLVAAAKAMHLEAKTSDLQSRNDSIPDVGSVRKLPAAFTLPVGGAAPAFFLGSNWVVYRVVEHQEAALEGLAKQSKEVENQLLGAKAQVAYEAFRAGLKDRMIKEGKLHVNEEALKRLAG